MPVGKKEVTSFLSPIHHKVRSYFPTFVGLARSFSSPSKALPTLEATGQGSSCLTSIIVASLKKDLSLTTVGSVHL